MAEKTNALEAMLNANATTPSTPTKTTPKEEVKEMAKETTAAPTTETEATPVIEVKAQVETTTDDPATKTPTLPAKKTIPNEEAGAIVVASTAGFGEMEGELDASDMIIPRLIQIHGVGDLATMFDPGTLCINGEAQLMGLAEKTKSEEIHFIPVKAQKVYRENFGYNDKETKDAIPREFASEAEVLEAGGRITEWESGKGLFRAAMNLLLAVTLPEDKITEDLDPFFVDEYDGQRYALLAMRLQKGAYNSAGKTLITDYGRVLKRMGGFPYATYRMYIENQKRGDNWIWTPVVKRIPKNNPQGLVEFFASLVG